MKNCGKEIIDLLKEQGVEMDIKLKNTINLLAFEVYEHGKDAGIKEGINRGINRVCKTLESKINEIRVEIE